jgi:hypothetical protein
MSGRGKGGKVKGKSQSRSKRAGLQFPVGRIHRWDRNSRFGPKTIIPSEIPVFPLSIIRHFFYISGLLFAVQGFFVQIIELKSKLLLISCFLKKTN